MSTDNNPKAQFQINNGNGWQTIAEVNIVDGVAQAPNEWTMVRVLRKQIVYTGYTPIEITAAPSNPRDTHFLGFATALLDEVLADRRTLRTRFPYFGPGDVEPFEASQRQIIARRAYDLAMHTILNIGPADLDMLTTEECVQRVPDLLELPKEPQS